MSLKGFEATKGVVVSPPASVQLYLQNKEWRNCLELIHTHKFYITKIFLMHTLFSNGGMDVLFQLHIQFHRIKIPFCNPAKLSKGHCNTLIISDLWKAGFFGTVPSILFFCMEGHLFIWCLLGNLSWKKYSLEEKFFNFYLPRSHLV